MVFVRNNANSWTANDLFIAHRGFTTSVFNPETVSISISLFPNPTSGQFTLSLPLSNAEISVLDMFGQQIIKTTAIQKKMNFHLYNSGVYFVCVKTSQGIAMRKIIVER